MVLAAGDVTEFLSIDLTTIIATLLNTLILFLVLKHFLFDKVNKVIEDRKMMLRKLTGRLTRQKKMPRSWKLSIQAD